MTLRCAILDDYQNVALKLADWSKITKDVEIKVFNEAVRRTDADTIRDVKDFDIVVMMRERTRFLRPVIEALPKLKLLITTRAHNAWMKASEPWQLTLGMDIEGKTLGLVGLGKLGARAAGVGKAFGMKVIAWSQNLTPERCKEVGVDYVSKDDLFRNADFLSIHVQLSDRTRGLVTTNEFGLMKKTSYLVNTS